MTQTEQTLELHDIAARVWGEVGGAAGLTGALTTTGPRAVLPSVFDVTGLATGSVAAATLAAAEFLAARADGPPLPVTVDSRQACAAFAAEGLFTPIGWERPAIWDPIAGNYQATDGWIRLHTNYAYHRAAVERLLGAADRDSVAAAVARWKAEELETAVVEAGGCAAAMRTRDQWLATPAGAATAGAPLADVTERRLSADPTRLGGGPGSVGSGTGGSGTGGSGTGGSGSVGSGSVGSGMGGSGSGGSLPYAGVRVLDLTRVIAGPVATRFLAGYGADVLRIDPPGFAEVPALLPETTAGKRTAALDLTAAADRAVFESLVGAADVLVTGLRADALSGLGYDDDTLAALNPALVVVSLDAYGWDGPWRDRRGFDSLVQMSAGIAAAGAAAAGADRPVPLPVQALDHACGYLTAAAVGRALTRRLAESAVSRIRLSLTGVAGLLWSLPRPTGQPPMPKPGDFALTEADTAWGPARRVPLPGAIAGLGPRWRVEAGPLGRHQPTWNGEAAEAR
ncbi:MAG TPA: CoA transferase [Trebonia sp.]|nr:CoA transferase [Trebonia sp.]